MVARVKTLEVSEPNADSAIPPPKADPIPPLWLFCIKTKKTTKTEINIRTKVNRLINSALMCKILNYNR